MFGYKKAAASFKNDCDAFATPYDTKTEQIVESVTASRHHTQVFRVAACTALGICIVLAGSISPTIFRKASSSPVNSGVQSVKSMASKSVTHDFQLVAYAADNKNVSRVSSVSSDDTANKVMLKTDINVELPGGKLEFMKNNGCTTDKNGNETWTSGSQFSETGFLCTGDGLSSVTYSAEKGVMHYISHEVIEKYKQAQQNCTVCTINVPKSKLSGKDGEYAIFKKLWRDGEFDEYKNKYFDGKDIDENRYGIGFEEGGDLDSGIVKVTIQDKQNSDYNAVYSRPTNSITANASDHNGNVDWSPSEEAWKAIQSADSARQTTGIIDYSNVPDDTLTVTATFTDGQTVTKHIVLSFSKEGILCAKLTD